MINFSIWDFHGVSSLEKLLETIRENTIVVQKAKKPYVGYELRNEIGIFEGFGNFSVASMECMGEVVKFVAFGTNCPICRKNQETDTYEVKDFIQRLIAFEKNGIVKVVILASQRNAEMVIKRIFSNKLVWGEIGADEYVTEDMLYWLFYRLREMPDELIVSEPKMFLNGIISYLGRTNDKINAVRGIGIRVSAMLGTLGMLLGEESLRALRPMIQFGEHELNIELYIGNSGKIYPNKYFGPYMAETDSLKLEVNLAILVCKYILPNIKKGYKDSCDKQEWSIYIKRVFLKAVGNEMSEKIEKVMKSIELDIEKDKEVNGGMSEGTEEFEEEELEDEIE